MLKTIVTIGGGTGTPLINKSLLLSGIPYVNSIVTVMDSGGVTGRMRTDAKGQEIAYSDGLRTLLSLIDPEKIESPQVKALQELLRKRNSRGHDLGYTIFSHYFNQADGFASIQKTLEDLTNMKFKGQVIPITLESTNICFKTQSSQVYKGEHELDDKRMSADTVKKIWLDPKVRAFPQAIELIEKADYLIFPCGSLHGSILVNFLPKGVKLALKNSKAKKILVTNLASNRNETHDFSPTDYVKIFQRYSGLKKPIDYILVPNLTRQEFMDNHKDVAARYAFDHSYFLGWSNSELKKVEALGVRVIRHDAMIIDPILKRLRHDPQKLAAEFKKIFA